jgi:hypothetical protein
MQTGYAIRSNGRRDGTTFRIIGDGSQIEFWGWQPDYYLINPKHPGGILIAPVERTTSLHQRHLENLLPMIASGKPDYSLPEAHCRRSKLRSRHLSAKHG